jgi:hypothetical protein
MTRFACTAAAFVQVECVKEGCFPALVSVEIGSGRKLRTQLGGEPEVTELVVAPTGSAAFTDGAGVRVQRASGTASSAPTTPSNPAPPAGVFHRAMTRAGLTVTALALALVLPASGAGATADGARRSLGASLSLPVSDGTRFVVYEPGADRCATGEASSGDDAGMRSSSGFFLAKLGKCQFLGLRLAQPTTPRHRAIMLT